VGKSSLLNALLGQKVAIVSDKPQTTRTRITGVLTRAEVQLIFIDTPGLHLPKTQLSRYMVRQVGESIADVDVAVLGADCERPISQAEKTLAKNFADRKLPAVLALNKIDKLHGREALLPQMAAYSALYDFAAILPISATQGEGLEALLSQVAGFAQAGPHFFPDDTLTDQPERVLVAEIVREKLLANMRDEIPHGTAVLVERMAERPGSGMLDIELIIYCEKESHKGMIIGKQGVMLKRIASQARQDAESFFGVKINLQCWVKVKEDWRDQEALVKHFGYQ
jgi:GTP-binding protein Era